MHCFVIKKILDGKGSPDSGHDGQKCSAHNRPDLP
jgi:hypothetical protein